MSATATRLGGVTIAVTNLERMAAFYTRVLGADLRPVQMGPVELAAGTLGGVEVQLCPRELAGIAAANNQHQLRFVVGDLDAALRATREAEGTILDEPTEHGGRRAAAVRDPDGNSIELVQGRR